MRIIVVSGEYPPMKGGVGRYTYNLVRAFAKKVNVDVSVAIGAAKNKENVIETDGVATYPGILRKGDMQNSARLLQLVSELKPDIVNVQYERGLYEVDTTIRHIISRFLHGSTLDRFYKECPVPVVSTLHTVFPYDEYRRYIKERALRKEGRFGFLPTPLRAAIRRWVMEQRYDILMQVVKLSDGIISPAKTIQDIVKRGTVIYHGAEPAVAKSPTSREEFRKELGLPADRMLLLAFGYVGSYKGFDILDNLQLPRDWSLVLKQTRHERGVEEPVHVKNKNIVTLHMGYLDDATMSKLFFACDAIIFPYKVVSISGVMFDALAHGLPFVASDLDFFREFTKMGLGVTCNMDAKSFQESLHILASKYPQYRANVEQFGPMLQWNNISDRHLEFFGNLISRHDNAEIEAEA